MSEGEGEGAGLKTYSQGPKNLSPREHLPYQSSGYAPG